MRVGAGVLGEVDRLVADAEEELGVEPAAQQLGRGDEQQAGEGDVGGECLGCAAGPDPAAQPGREDDEQQGGGDGRDVEGDEEGPLVLEPGLDEGGRDDAALLVGPRERQRQEHAGERGDPGEDAGGGPVPGGAGRGGGGGGQ
ncbi:hypothetical protein CCO04_02160 [Pimelobacter sp. 30-1]|nr:hypothetical protein [Pimelobacter sp. 30-1]